jgi:hypothetical protein
MDIDKYLHSGKLEQYVLGLSSMEERKEVEQLAKKFPEIDAYILELHGCMNLCSEANEIPVSEELNQKSTCKTFHLKNRRNLVAEHGVDDTYQKTRTISWSAGIASIFVIGLSTLSFFLYQGQQNAKNEIALLTTQLHHLKLDNETLVENSGKLLQQYAVLKDENTQHVSLRGLKTAPQTHGIVYWNKDHGKAFLSICNLPETPEGHQFYVWADVDGKHQKVAILNPNSSELLHDLSFPKECNGFCVTLEKEGADASPTIEQMLVKGYMLKEGERTID